MSTPWRRRIILMLIVAVAFVIGSNVQQQLGIEFSLEGLEGFRQWVQGLGWLGPVAFILLCIFRLFIGLSSHLTLILGGLAFGIVGGILWGTIGILASSIVLYTLAKLLGANWVQQRFGPQYERMVERIRRVGVIAVFVVTAHPVGVLTPAHLAAGLVGIKPFAFFTAVGVAAPLRATPYAVLGTAVLDMNRTQSIAIGVGLVLLLVVPLLFPAVRAWVIGDKSP